MFECPICKKRFKTLFTLKQHFKKRHKDLEECPLCGKRVKRLSIHRYYYGLTCEKHYVLHYLLSSKFSKLRKDAGEVAEKVLKVEKDE